MDNEIWKDIPEFEGYYQASKTGLIRRIGDYSNQSNSWKLNEPKILKQKDNGKGYKYVILSVDGVRYNRYVHRLVASTFIPNPNNYKEINHKDGYKVNNNVDNLEWCNHSQNGQHAYANGLRTVKGCYGALKRKVAQLSEDNVVLHIFNSIDEASTSVGCKHSSISCCCWYAVDNNHYNGRKFIMCKGYKWRFATPDMKIGDIVDK